MAIEQWRFFNVPHHLWHGPILYNGHLQGTVTHTPIAKRLAVEQSQPVFTTLVCHSWDNYIVYTTYAFILFSEMSFEPFSSLPPDMEADTNEEFGNSSFKSASSTGDDESSHEQHEEEPEESPQELPQESPQESPQELPQETPENLPEE